MDAGAVVSQIGGGRARGDGGGVDPHDRGAAIEAVRGAGEDAQAHLTAGQPHRLQMPLDLLQRAPLVAIAHQHADLRGPDARVEELVTTPRIRAEHRGQAASTAQHGVREAARGRREHRGAAAAVALRTDARRIDLGPLRQHLPGREHVVRAGGEGELRLVGHRRGHAARAERVEHEGGEAGAGERLGMRQVHGRHTEAAGHDDDERQAGRRAGRQEQLAIDGDARHLARLGDRLVVVPRRGRRHVDHPARRAVGEGDGLLAKADTSGKRAHGGPLYGSGIRVGRPVCAVSPPSATTAAPVTYEARSEARNITTPGHLLRPAQALHRNHPCRLLRETGDRQRRPEQRGVDGAGAHAVHPDAAGRVLDGGHPREIDDAGLGRVVGADGEVGEEAGDRRRVHDRAAAAGEQLGDGTLHRPEHAGEAELDGVRPHALVEVTEKRQPALATRQRGLAEGVVVQDVEAAEGLHGAADHRVDPCRGAGIGRDRQRHATGLGDLLGHRLGARPVDVGHAHLGPALREAQRRGAPDARTRPRYQRDLAVEPHVTSSVCSGARRSPVGLPQRTVRIVWAKCSIRSSVSARCSLRKSKTSSLTPSLS